MAAKHYPSDGDRRTDSLAVLHALDEHVRMHVTELEDALDLDPVVADQVCFELQRDGYVRGCGGGEYKLTAKGERRLRTRNRQRL